jgi:hypothetical protein
MSKGDRDRTTNIDAYREAEYWKRNGPDAKKGKTRGKSALEADLLKKEGGRK